MRNRMKYISRGSCIPVKFLPTIRNFFYCDWSIAVQLRWSGTRNKNILNCCF